MRREAAALRVRRELSARLRALAKADGRKMCDISEAAGVGRNALSRIACGSPCRFSTAIALLYELDASSADLDAIIVAGTRKEESDSV